jgi:hypothetical protein
MIMYNDILILSKGAQIKLLLVEVLKVNISTDGLVEVSISGGGSICFKE